MTKRRRKAEDFPATSAVIREWLIEHDYVVAERGRLSEGAIELFVRKTRRPYVKGPGTAE